MTDTTPTESNLSGLDRKDFQKNINSRKNRFIYPQKCSGHGSGGNQLRLCNSFDYGARQKRKICQCHFRT